MKTTTKARLFGGSAMLFAPAHTSMMARGAMIARAPDDGGGDGGDDDEDANPPEAQTVAKSVYDTLVSAHTKLKADIQKKRTQLTEAQSKVTDLEQEVETLRAQADGNTDKATAVQQAVQAERTKWEKEVSARDKTISDLTTELNDTLSENELEKALSEVRIKDDLREGAKAILARGLEVVSDEDGRNVYLNNLPVAEAVKAWSETDKGKAYVLDGNTGGGASGGKTKHSGKNPWKAETLNLTEQDRIQAKDPALAGRLKAEAGVA